MEKWKDVPILVTNTFVSPVKVCMTAQTGTCIWTIPAQYIQEQKLAFWRSGHHQCPSLPPPFNKLLEKLCVLRVNFPSADSSGKLLLFMLSFKDIKPERPRLPP